MAVLSTKQRRYLRYAAGGAFVSGIILVTGFLSFTGMLVLNDSIYLAIAAFFLAGGIEGEVYAQNINTSLIKILTGDYLKDVLISKKLAKLAKDKKYANNHFLMDYKTLLDYAKKLEAKHSHDEKHIQELEKTKRSLKWMQRYFRDFILDKKGELPVDESIQKEISQLVTPEEKKSLKNEIEKKILLSRLSWLLNIGAGISCGLVGLEVAQSSILAVSAYFGVAISGTALTASVFGLSIVAAIAYTLLIHNTISSMIQNDTLKKWAKKTRHFFSRKTDEKVWKYGLRVLGGALGVGIVLGLGIFATVATAGTWWYAAKAGAKMIPRLARFASTLRTVTVSLMSITAITFTIFNSLQSAKELVKISLREKFHEIYAKIMEHKDSETTAQFYNPIRFIIQVITIPFKALSFIGHLISMAIMGDKLAGVDPRLTTALNVGSEGLTDIHRFVPEKKQGVSTQTAVVDEDDDDDEEEEDHDHHLDLTGKFLKLALFPLYALSALWDYAFRDNKKIKQPGGDKAGIERPTYSSTWKAWEELEKKARIQRAIQKRGEKIKKEGGMEIINKLQKSPIKKSGEATFFKEENPGRATQAVCEKIIKMKMAYT